MEFFVCILIDILNLLFDKTLSYAIKLKNEDIQFLSIILIFVG